MAAPKKTESGIKPVAAVERALDLMDAFRGSDRSLSLADISTRTGLFKSTALRLAGTLEHRGYLYRNPDGSYRIGAKPFFLGAMYQASFQEGDVIMLALQKLAEATGESASYNVRCSAERLCLFRVNSPQIIRDNVYVGDMRPLNRGAAGRLLMAFSRPLNSRFAAVRKRLIASSAGEIEAHMSGLAAPVFDGAGNVLAALTLSGPRSRFGAAAVARMEKTLRRAAKQLSDELGGSGEAYLALPPAKRRAR